MYIGDQEDTKMQESMKVKGVFCKELRLTLLSDVL